MKNKRSVLLAWTPEREMAGKSNNGAPMCWGNVTVTSLLTYNYCSTIGELEDINLKLRNGQAPFIYLM
ncbi:hypothetical protein ACOSQ3_008661 [Xanthoceras sorbifolium]